MKLLLAIIVFSLLISFCLCSGLNYITFSGSFTDSKCKDVQPGVGYYMTNGTCLNGLSSFLGTTTPTQMVNDSYSWGFDVQFNQYETVKRFSDSQGNCENSFDQYDFYNRSGICVLSPEFAQLTNAYYTYVNQIWIIIYPVDTVVFEVYDVSSSKECDHNSNFLWSGFVSYGFKYESKDGSNDVYQYSCSNGIPIVTVCGSDGKCQRENIQTDCVNGVKVFCH